MECETITTAQVLKKAREKQGLSIKTIAQEICVQSSYLKAIETGDYDKLPAQTFAVGFVRSYASFLGEDADQIVSAFKKEAGMETRNPTIEVKPEHAAERGGRMPVWLSPLAGIVGVSFCWVVLSGSYTTTALVADADHSVQEQERLRALTSTLNEDQVEVLPADNKAVANSAPEGEAALVLGNAQNKVVSSASSSASGVFFSTAAHADEIERSVVDAAVLIKAEQDSWLRLTRKDGSEVWAGILRAGQEYVPDEVGEMLLTTSNAGGLYLSALNADFEQLGKRGEILIDTPVVVSVPETPLDLAGKGYIGSR